MRLVKLFFMLLLGQCTLWSQDLLPDGSFEQLSCPDNEINSVTETGTWYSLSADVYYRHPSCPFDPVASQFIRGLTKPIRPYREFGFIFLEAALSFSGYFISEGFGVELNTPLIEGQYYYFEMASYQCQDVSWPETEGFLCDPAPARDMKVYLGPSKITLESTQYRVRDGAVISSVISNTPVRLIDNQASSGGIEFDEWNFYWDCFRADGTERHLGVSGEAGLSRIGNNCFGDSIPGLSHSLGYAIDGLRLVPIPLSIDTTMLICPGGIEVDLEDIIPGPFFDKATFLWDDGYSQLNRLFAEEGTYVVEMVLPCVTVPITFQIVEFKCLADIYVANVFTPNNDGVNDVLQPMIASDIPLSAYNFYIYNRWGERIYSTNATSDFWDGRIKNDMADSGVYTWMIQYTLENNPAEMVTITGNTTVLKM